MAISHVWMDGHSACETTVLYEVQVGNAGQQLSIESALPVPSQILYGPIGPMIKSEVIKCVLFSNCQLSSPSYLQVVENSVLGNSSSALLRELRHTNSSEQLKKSVIILWAGAKRLQSNSYKQRRFEAGDKKRRALERMLEYLVLKASGLGANGEDWDPPRSGEHVTWNFRQRKVVTSNWKSFSITLKFRFRQKMVQTSADWVYWN